ncbi:MAG: class IV adenylate cyclase [Anaerolineaceae bacterium]|nr:class IV adenylate cyclase [Anaerolineaceae bacterium]
MQTNQELEVKFYLNDLPQFEKNLQGLGAELIQPRVHEVNLRFDTPDGTLTHTSQVLRLRQDERSRFTYKRRKSGGNGSVSSRQEIEFEVSSFENARLFLEALGYQVYVTYEKYRRTYHLAGLEIMLDETPLGDFIEIEGPDVPSIETLAAALHLNWQARSLEGYMMLLDKIKTTRSEIQNLTFEEFTGLNITAGDLGLTPADEPPA